MRSLGTCAIQTTRLATVLGKLVLHDFRLGEVPAVPDHVLVLVGVLNVEPDDVERDVGLVEAPLDVEHVRLALVVPPALVVRDRKELRKRRPTRQGRVLVEDGERRRPQEDEEVEDARLGDPVRCRRRCGGAEVCRVGGLQRLAEGSDDCLGRRYFRDVDPGLGSDDVEDGNGRASSVGLQERNRSILQEWILST